MTATATKQIKVTLIKSPFGRLQIHRSCVRGLGLSSHAPDGAGCRTPENMGWCARPDSCSRLKRFKESP